MLVFQGGEMLGNTKLRMGFAAFAVGFACLATAGDQATGEPDAAARARINAAAQLMAGLPNKTHAFTQTAVWKEHSDYMRTSWVRLYGRQVAAMTTWRDAKLGQACPAGGTLMYPFSGPDFLNAHWLFPACDTIVMFGLEHIGEAPNIDAMNDRALGQLASDVRMAMSSFLERNYFITDSMTKQLRTSHLRGVLPVFMLSMALSGMEIVRIVPNDLAPLPRDTAAEGQPMRQLKGVTIEYVASGSPAIQRVHYFTVDAADKGLAHYPEFIAYVRSLAPTTTFIKSASYLLHGSEFRQMRSALLDISSVIVQDDTGVPFAMLENRGWRVQLHGRYGRPIPPFGGAFQVELSRAYKARLPAPLPFTFGYQYHDFRDTRSNLIVAQRAVAGIPIRAP
jgi:hypothetical protein